MTEPVTWTLDDGIGRIEIDNPPVNALSNAVRKGVSDALKALGDEPSLTAVVIACTGRTFIAGADIREFGKPRQPPTLAELCDQIESFPHPVVAALHGTALGGGFEIALACHARVATVGTRIGLPEVKLGLIPGAGGTNRLARIVGASEALQIALSGDPVDSGRAQALGLLDKVTDGEPVSQAVALARELKQPPVPTRSLPIEGAESAALEERIANALSKTAGQHAPAAIVESLRRAIALPFDEAVAADREAFAELSAGAQSKALRHAFFAERQAAKFDSSAGSGKRIEKVAILGAGTMGGGIAMSFAAAGIPVLLIDTGTEALERGLARIKSNYGRSVSRKSISAEEAEQRLARIATATDRASAADADLVIEAVFEDMDLKKQIFSDLEAICAPDCILASNTSALDIDAIAQVLKHRDRFVGMHFFSPANVMKLCEIVRGADTSAATIASAITVARRIAKIPVVSGNCDGFIGNRMVAKRSAQVDRLLQQGALPQQVDAALKAFGFPMGPLAINDMSGLDVGYSIRKRRGTIFPIADAVAESGRLGQKTGGGYYRYEAGSRTPIADPEVAALIEQVRAKLGVVPREFDESQMIQRMIYPLINEGAKILEEGIALRASDIDVVWLNGYGFPRWRGGPMFHAGTIGLSEIANKLTLFAEETGDASLMPSALLVRLAGAGATFDDWDKGALRDVA
ncbi:MAG: 3-hydroxyacyl-CoA dehydrogenase [Sphingomonas sp.]|nr:3-hydroxyacyl-CoA dehydrogenase [Sphingomonas sp.]